ncbi:MAG: hypothetical protein E6K60_13210 [Nitrospirae bacterium]|nr:MAG: hypothetical protein E6K60_13210 [Nitrospirota bacterium]
MTHTSPTERKSVLFAGLLLLALTPAAWAESLTHSAVKTEEPQKLQLTVGKSVVIDTPVAIKRASLANPDITDAIVLSPRQIYVTGKMAGMTNLTLWENGQVFTVFDLEVVPDFSRFKEQLAQLLPDEKDIRAVVSRDHLTLKGMVSNSVNMAQALALAEAYSPKKVINLLQVASVPKEPEDLQEVKVDVIKGSNLSSVKFTQPK